MITSDKVNAALGAIHGIIISARALAYNEASYLQIAKLLDHAEYLPGLLSDGDDKTQEFETYLEGIVEEFPGCRFVLERFQAG